MAGQFNVLQLTGQQQFFGLAPKDGPVTIPLNLDFTLGLVIPVDLEIPVQTDQIAFVQACYVDNSLNAGSLTLVFSVSQQTITVPPNSQGYFPLFVPNAPKFVATLSAATANTNTIIQLLNIPVAPAVWSVLGGAAVTISGSLPAGSNLIGGVSIQQGGHTAVVNAAGALTTTDSANGPATPGTAVTFAELSALRYTAAGVTLTDGQQAALAGTSKGALIVSGTTPVTASATPNNTAAAYAAGQCIGGLITFANFFASGMGSLETVRVIFNGSVASVALTLVVFSSNPTSSTFTDNAAMVIAKADWGKVILTTPLPLDDTGSPSASIPSVFGQNFGVTFEPDAAGTLYLAILATAAFTPTTTTDMVVNVTGLQF